MKAKQKIIDISPEISKDLAVWPGDLAFQRKISMSFEDQNHMDLSGIQSTLHLGAHADAPSHYHAQGNSIDQIDLSVYMGPCQVIEVQCSPHKSIKPDDIEQIEITTARVLFKTNSYPDPQIFNKDFMSLSPELVEYLAKSRVLLVGIDTPSVDPFSSKDLIAHKALYAHKIANLEGLVLSHVAPGNYNLIALPLKLKDCDASPVRAILTS